MNLIHGFVGFNLAQFVIQLNLFSGLFEERNYFRISNSFAHDWNGDGLDVVFSRFWRRWWRPVRSAMEEQGLGDRPVYFVSSNPHSLVNLVTPTSAVVMGGLAIARVPYGTWIRFVLPVLGALVILSVIVISLDVLILGGM